MKKIAIVTFGKLPIPASQGGAVESLITNLLDENEKEKKIKITTFSYYDRDSEKISHKYEFNCCNFINTTSIKVKVIDFSNRIIKKILFNKKEYISYFMKNVSKQINKGNFDYVIVFGGGVLVPQLCSLIKSKVIMYFHTDPFYYLDEIQCRRIVDCCDKVFCVSKFICNQIEKLIPTRKDDIYTIYNCIDLEIPNEIQKKHYRTMIREKYDIKEEDKVVLYCGRLEREKGIKELLLALKELNITNLKILIAGKSSNEEFFIELKEIAKQIKSKVIFTGYITHNELVKYYSSADISVIPSICNEAAGLTVVESISMGVNTIATNKGGIPEYTIGTNVTLVNYDKDNFIHNLKVEIEKNIIQKNSLKFNNNDYIEFYSVKRYYKDFVALL